MTNIYEAGYLSIFDMLKYTVSNMSNFTLYQRYSLREYIPMHTMYIHSVRYIRCSLSDSQLHIQYDL